MSNRSWDWAIVLNLQRPNYSKNTFLYKSLEIVLSCIPLLTTQIYYGDIECYGESIKCSVKGKVSKPAITWLHPVMYVQWHILIPHLNKEMSSGGGKRKGNLQRRDIALKVSLVASKSNIHVSQWAHKRIMRLAVGVSWDKPSNSHLCFHQRSPVYAFKWWESLDKPVIAWGADPLVLWLYQPS